MKSILVAGAAANLTLEALGRPRRANKKRLPVGPNGCVDTSGNATQRRNEAYRVRHQVALAEMQVKPPLHPNNGDECRFANRIGNYSKGLPHNSLGEVDSKAYDLFLNAMAMGEWADFEQIPLGCADGYKLVNPQAGLAFDLEGADSHALAMPPAPAFGSDEENAEMIELYWMTLLRDVQFEDYATNPLAQQAAEDLTRLGAAFTGPKTNGKVTTGTLFRDNLPGALVGPYCSQFRMLPLFFGANWMEQSMLTILPGQDCMTKYDEWLNIQNGCRPSDSLVHDSTPRYIRCARDAGWWVHSDIVSQAAMLATLILLYPMRDKQGNPVTPPLNPGNPYLRSRNQVGFGTFGPPHGMTLVMEPCSRALKAVRYQKYFVHRRLRPEEYAGAIDNTLRGAANYPVNLPQLSQSPALELIYQKFGSLLLPQVFPEGCPLHPSYGSGHATVTGACVTMAKAFFDESWVIPNPVVPSPDGTTLVPYTGADADRLTLGGELNKLVSNIGQSRNQAGVHWRSDEYQSYLLGEAVAISILRDQQNNYNEDFHGFTFTKFDGTKITV